MRQRTFHVVLTARCKKTPGFDSELLVRCLFEAEIISMKCAETDALFGISLAVITDEHGTPLPEALKTIVAQFGKAGAENMEFVGIKKPKAVSA